MSNLHEAVETAHREAWNTLTEAQQAQFDAWIEYDTEITDPAVRVYKVLWNLMSDACSEECGLKDCPLCEPHRKWAAEYDEHAADLMFAAGAAARTGDNRVLLNEAARIRKAIDGDIRKDLDAITGADNAAH